MRRIMPFIMQVQNHKTVDENNSLAEINVLPRSRNGKWTGEDIQSWELYSFNFRYRVVFPMPSKRAASNLSPLSWAIVLRMVCFSNSAIGMILLVPFPLEPDPLSCRLLTDAGRSPKCNTGPVVKAHARSRQFSSSRTFPGQS